MSCHIVDNLPKTFWKVESEIIGELTDCEFTDFGITQNGIIEECITHRVCVQWEKWYTPNIQLL